MDWRTVFAVALGGALGSVARFGVATLMAQRFGPGFPWGTLTVNLAGSFAIGAVLELSLAGAYGMSVLTRTFIAVGILGGFTTFSSFSAETLQLIRDGAPVLALTYAAGSVLLGLGAAYAGLAAARALIP